MPRLLKSELAGIMPHAQHDKWLLPLSLAMHEFSITSPQRMAAFLAQIAHESHELNRLEENLNYSAKRLCQVWPKRFPTAAAAEPCANNPERLANRVYAGRLGNGNEASGDGWRFRGRGPIQLTGRSNYAACRKALGVDLIKSPYRLLEPGTAARSAAWFWSSRGLNALADHEPGDDDEADFRRITTIINGGTAGIAERTRYWASARRALGA